MWSSDHLSFSVQWQLHRATTKLITVVIQLRGLLANQHDFLSYRWRDFSPPWIDPLCRCGSGSRRTRPLSMLLLPFCTVAPTDLAAHLPDTPDFSMAPCPLPAILLPTATRSIDVSNQWAECGDLSPRAKGHMDCTFDLATCLITG